MTMTKDARVNAVVLDWAGTTVDFGCMAPVEAFRALFESYDVGVDEADVRRFMGYDKREHLRAIMGLEHVAADWERAHRSLPAETDIMRLYAGLEPLLATAVNRFARPIDGVPELVERLRGRDILIGSTTGYVTATMEHLAPRAGLLGYSPDALVASDEVPAGRPAPFMCYLNALRLGIYPLETMVKVGDTLADIQEGRNAGMWTVGVVVGGSDLGLTQAQVDSLPSDELAHLAATVQRRHLEAGAHFAILTLDELESVLERIDRAIAAGEHPALTPKRNH